VEAFIDMQQSWHTHPCSYSGVQHLRWSCGGVFACLVSSSSCWMMDGKELYYLYAVGTQSESRKHLLTVGSTFQMLDWLLRLAFLFSSTKAH
jgi:hypothetical protein